LHNANGERQQPIFFFHFQRIKKTDHQFFKNLASPLALLTIESIVSRGTRWTDYSIKLSDRLLSSIKSWKEDILPFRNAWTIEDPSFKIVLPKSIRQCPGLCGSVNELGCLDNLDDGFAKHKHDAVIAAKHRFRVELMLHDVFG